MGFILVFLAVLGIGMGAGLLLAIIKNYAQIFRPHPWVASLSIAATIAVLFIPDTILMVLLLVFVNCVPMYYGAKIRQRDRFNF